MVQPQPHYPQPPPFSPNMSFGLLVLGRRSLSPLSSSPLTSPSQTSRTTSIPRWRQARHLPQVPDHPPSLPNQPLQRLAGLPSSPPPPPDARSHGDDRLSLFEAQQEELPLMSSSSTSSSSSMLDWSSSLLRGSGSDRSDRIRKFWFHSGRRVLRSAFVAPTCVRGESKRRKHWFCAQ